MKYTLICPKCKHELNYDSDYYDRTITRLGCEISDIIKQRAEHKLLPYQVQRQKDDWWRRSKRALAEKQKELAEYLGVQQNTYSDYETGKINVPIEALIKLADYYHVSTDYLLGRTDEPTPPPKSK